MPEGNVGEIWIRSKSRAAGYWSQPAKTKEDFGGCVADEPEVFVTPSDRYIDPFGADSPSTWFVPNPYLKIEKKRL